MENPEKIALAKDFAPPVMVAGVSLAKGVGVFLMAVLGLGVIWMMISKIIDRVTAPPSSENDFEYDEAKLTLSSNSYIQMADEMHISMDGGGTVEESVFNVLEELNNPHDWAKLVVVYGKREICTNRALIDFGCEKLNLIRSLKLEFFGNWNGTFTSFFATGVYGVYSNQQDQKRLQNELERLSYEGVVRS